MLEVIIHPDSFFKSKMNEEIGFKVPLMIMGSVWIIGILKVVMIMSVFSDIIPDNLVPMLVTIIVLALLISSVVLLFVWFFVSAIFYLASAFLRGKGSFKRVMQVVSYGFIPSAIEDFAVSVYVVYVISNLDFVNTIQNVSETEFIKYYLTELIYSNLSITILLIIFSLIMTPINLYIWIYGLKYSRNLSLKGAIIAILVPVALYTLYNWLSLILYFIEIS